jgi:hypothetical protein
MLSLKPIPENKADRETLKIYQSIKQTLGLNTVPLVFQYMAAFPPYFSYLWQQSIRNLSDSHFQKQVKEIKKFAETAMDQIYFPGKTMNLFLEDLKDSAEEKELINFVTSASETTSSLYLLSLAIRESVKGAYLGIKQIGERIPEKDKDIFTNLSEGLFENVQTENKEAKDQDARLKRSSFGIISRPKTGLIRSLLSEFFKIMDLEIRELVKREEYLVRRVELERFALSLLPFIPHPLESSFATIIRQTQDYPNFPELVYLVSELFPTQAPFRLLANAVMKKALSLTKNNSSANNLTQALSTT